MASAMTASTSQPRPRGHRRHEHACRLRRPVAVATLTMIFALAGRLFKKHELVQTGRWNDRAELHGAGLDQRTLGLSAQVASARRS